MMVALRPLSLAAALAIAFLACLAAHAAEPVTEPAATKRPPVDLSGLAPSHDNFGRALGDRPRATRLARALDDAWKKDPAQANLKAWSDVLIKCQQASNPAWTTALMRSEPQQAHCYRY